MHNTNLLDNQSTIRMYGIYLGSTFQNSDEEMYSQNKNDLRICLFHLWIFQFHYIIMFHFELFSQLSPERSTLSTLHYVRQTLGEDNF